MAFQQHAGVAMIQDDSNVVHLSKTQGFGHRCGWSCSVEHVWGNLYMCKNTGNTHVCDMNCDQRIIYDNHSSICRASRKIFPLHNQKEQVVRGMRRKSLHNEPLEGITSTSSKRNRCGYASSQEQQVVMSMATPFASPFQQMNINMVPCAASTAGDSSMDMS